MGKGKKKKRPLHLKLEEKEKMKGRAVRNRWKELRETGTRRQEAAKKKLDLSTLRLRVRKKNWKILQADEEEDRKR